MLPVWGSGFSDSRVSLECSAATCCPSAGSSPCCQFSCAFLAACSVLGQGLLLTQRRSCDALAPEQGELRREEHPSSGREELSWRRVRSAHMHHLVLSHLFQKKYNFQKLHRQCNDISIQQCLAEM